jgi:uncharacterized protein (TIGR00251 family)
MTKEWCTATAEGVRITVQIAPNARKNEVFGVLDDTLKLRVQAQPIEGMANEALTRYLADMLNVPRSAVVIAHGLTSKRKIIDIAHAKLTAEEARRILLSAM